MLIALGFFFGCFIGSFLNVCIHRLPRNLSVVTPPSRCGACGTVLTWYDNLPLLGYVMLRGRSRCCGTAFSPRYVVMEIITGVLTAGLLWWSLTMMPPAEWLLLAGIPETVATGISAAVILAFAFMLLVASVIDFDHMIIPDELTIAFQACGPLLALGCASSMSFSFLWSPATWLGETGAFVTHADNSTFIALVLGGGGAAIALLALSLPVAYAVYVRKAPHQQRWSDKDYGAFRTSVWWFMAVSFLHLIVIMVFVSLGKPWANDAAVHMTIACAGSLFGWWILYGVGLVGTVLLGRNAMGFGDVKLLAPIGALLGPIGVLYTVLVASLVGVMVGLPGRLLKAQREIPFGPSLSVGAIVVLLFGVSLHRWLFGAQ